MKDVKIVDEKRKSVHEEYINIYETHLKHGNKKVKETLRKS
jgi:hypothetical protein